MQKLFTKTKSAITALLVSIGMLSLLTACNNNNNNSFNPSKAVVTKFQQMYPNTPTSQVTWLDKSPYEVGTFNQKESGYLFWAWYKSDGTWAMTQHFMDFGMFPSTAKQVYESGYYANWSVFDQEFLQRPYGAGVFVLYVESPYTSSIRMALYFTQDGKLYDEELLLADPYEPNRPEFMNATVKNYLDQNMGGATILDYFTRNEGFQVNVMVGTAFKRVQFNMQSQWVSTSYLVAKSTVPANVMTALTNAGYTGTVNRTYLYETSGANYYMFYVQTGQEVSIVKVELNGTVTLIGMY